MSVSQLQVLRRALALAGGEYKVYKNTLVRLAAKESGLEELEALLTGPTALAFVTGDVSAVAKALKDFARQHPSLVVKGAVVGGGLFDAAQTSAIAELPSRDVLLAQIAGALAAPMQRFASLLAALPQKFAYTLSALIDDRGGIPAPAAEATAQPAAEEPTAKADDVGAAPSAEAAAGEPVVPAEGGALDATAKQGEDAADDAARESGEAEGEIGEAEAPEESAPDADDASA